MFALLFGFLARLITVEGLKMIAYRAMLLTLVTVILPIVLEKFIVYLIHTASGIAFQHIESSGLAQAAITFSGLAGYLADRFRLVEAGSMIISAITLRFVLNLIPIIRV